jgi:predicted transcriptional regulator
MSTEQEMAKTTFRLPKSLLREVKHYATDHDKTDTDIFVEALREYLNKRAGKR